MEQQRLAAALRRNFVAEIPLLTSAEACERLGVGPSELRRLISQHELFSLTVEDGTELLPAFQIKEGEPDPVIRQVLETFAGDEAWTVALWFTSPSGWLGGRRPIQLLDDDPGAVVQTAIRTAAPLEF